MTDTSKCLVCGPTFVGTCPHRYDTGKMGSETNSESLKSLANTVEGRDDAEYMAHMEMIATGLAEYFKGDVRKAAYWLMLENLNFGGVSPAQLIAAGRIHKVAQFVRDAKEGNLP